MASRRNGWHTYVPLLKQFLWGADNTATLPPDYDAGSLSHYILLPCGVP